MAHIYHARPAVLFGNRLCPDHSVAELRVSRLNGIKDAKYIGLGNYIKMFHDPYFWNSVQNNLLYVVIVVLMQVFIGLFFALLLSYVKKGAGIFRTLYYLPAVVVTVAIAQMFRNFYSLQPLGLLNMFLGWIGLGHLQNAWLSDPHTALIAVSIPEGWRFTGMYMVIFYAALIAIPKEVEEAATIDGVNGWQLIRYIKLPSIKHVLSLALIMCTTGALRGSIFLISSVSRVRQPSWSQLICTKSVLHHPIRLRQRDRCIYRHRKLACRADHPGHI